MTDKRILTPLPTRPSTSSARPGQLIPAFTKSPSTSPTALVNKSRSPSLSRASSSQRIAELAPAPRPSFLARLSSTTVPTLASMSIEGDGNEPQKSSKALPELVILDEKGMAEHEAKRERAWELQSVAIRQICGHAYPRCPKCGFKGTYRVADCFKERHFQWCTTHKTSVEFGRKECNVGYVSRVEKTEGEDEKGCELADFSKWRL